MRERLLSLLLRTKRPPLAVGIICGALCIAAEVLLSLFLERLTSGDFLGGIYLLGVLLVSVVWGLGLGLGTLVGSAVAFNYFNLRPRGASRTGRAGCGPRSRSSFSWGSRSARSRRWCAH
ncbi:DUF4118 domain-containing protein [Streptosporangium vulgare]|uniref:DUF4118 domain-containing protein n=1 Tax=Streptosporangium vulgare TaxID=46190 RepID=UPI0033898378